MRWLRYDWMNGTSNYVKLTEIEPDKIQLEIINRVGDKINSGIIAKSVIEIKELPLEYKRIIDVNDNRKIMDEDKYITKMIREQISSGKTEFDISIGFIFYMRCKIEILPFEILLYTTIGDNDNNIVHQKPKYVLFDKDSLTWCLLYCTTYDCEAKEPLKEIGKAMISFQYRGEFNPEEYLCMNSGGIKNKDSLFIMGENGVDYIWQLGSKVSDMENVIVPNLYRVRKIGMIV